MTAHNLPPEEGALQADIPLRVRLQHERIALDAELHDLVTEIGALRARARDKRDRLCEVEWQLAQIPTDDELTVPGLLARGYHYACPSWGEIRWTGSGMPGGVRLLYCKTREAARAALQVLDKCPHDWNRPSQDAATDRARRLALTLACKVEGVSLG